MQFIRVLNAFIEEKYFQSLTNKKKYQAILL